MSDYLADVITKIAHNLAKTQSFSGYTYKDEMIQDGILNCIQYAHNFNA